MPEGVNPGQEGAEQFKFLEEPKQTEQIQGLQEVVIAKAQAVDQASPVEKENKKINLRDLLQPPSEDYSKIIENNARMSRLESWPEFDLVASFSDNLQEDLLGTEDAIGDHQREDREKVVNLFKERLRDSILVDLGGRNLDKLAEAMECKGYIGVDKYNWYKDQPLDPTENLSKNSDYKNTQNISVKADMLDFLSRLPDNSVSISISGIDNAIARLPEYHNALVKEIARVCKRGGIIFGVESTSLDKINKAIQQRKPEIVDNSASDPIESLVFTHGLSRVDLPESFDSRNFYKIFEKKKVDSAEEEATPVTQPIEKTL